MIPRLPSLWFCFTLCLVGFRPALAENGNRFAHLEEADPFYVSRTFPKLATPQWVGEPGVDAVVILAVDDMREPKKYEAFLRPLLNRLKKIDGRAPVSIMANALDARDPQLAAWLAEGLSLDVHTLTHPCPLLAKGNFDAAATNYHNGVDLLFQIQGNTPVAFRMPCCDSINSPSPRFYAEIFNNVSQGGHFLTIDSSVMNLTTPKDEALPKALTTDPDGREKFRKYVPFPSFVTTIEDYPYPYVIGRLCWEFPAMAPSDWEAQHVHGPTNAITVADWKAALDATVLKQGTFTFIFHPHGWIKAEQLVEFVDYAVEKYGKKVKFLNFAEAQRRLNETLLSGQPLRDATGGDNGVRLLDLNRDGFLDVVIGNERLQKTRLWDPARHVWNDFSFPAKLVSPAANGHPAAAEIGFGTIGANHRTALFDWGRESVWTLNGNAWKEERGLWRGLDRITANPAESTGADRGIRLRDLDGDGQTEVIVSNPRQNVILGWSEGTASWNPLPYALPPGVTIVNAAGEDNGLRFVDLNEDGSDDLVLSNEKSCSIHLFVAQAFLGFQQGWSREVMRANRGDSGELPMIVRSGPHRSNGAWFHSRQLWVQNEDTATLPDLVDRRSYEQLLAGLQPPAKSPQASLESIHVRPGFKVELVATEPLVEDPVAFDWSADGKLWVVEMGDYPLGLDGHGKPGGKVKYLEDTDGDGRYDKVTVFLENVPFPTGVFPWRKGVIVSSAPELFYAEDVNGDGKADLHRTLFRGFGEGNQQHRLNGFDYGLDNWLHGANGDSGGEIRAIDRLRENGSAALSRKPVSLRGHDFRFQPDTGEFEAIEGQTQFGRHRDDWGNWFGNNNPTWLWHYFIPERYVARNPFLAVRSLKEYLANSPDPTRVFAISRTIQRFNDIGALGHVTSGNSATPYRDELFGPEFASSIFISEPVHNVVHREVLEPNGPTFTSHRARGEEQIEFLASADNWFRPTMLKIGPDGALYICDMYRLVIEHPEWIPKDTQKSLDLRAGSDKGRIYRVYPEGAKLRTVPRLDRLNTQQLTDALDSPNGWQRDTAQRLLVHAADPAAAPLLKKLAAANPHAKTRVQALATLDGLGALTPEILLSALRDRDAHVREEAVRLAESFYAARFMNPGAVPPPAQKKRDASRDGLLKGVFALAKDESIRVRYQLALSLGSMGGPEAGKTLAQLAASDFSNPQVQLAVMSSAVPHLPVLMESAVSKGRPSVVNSDFLEQLLGLAASSENMDSLQLGLRALAQPATGGFAAWQFSALAGLLDALDRRGGSLAKLGKDSAGLENDVRGLQPLFTQARRIALDESARAEDRALGVRLIGRGMNGAAAEDLDELGRLLSPQVPGAVQEAALRTLSARKEKRLAGFMIRGFRSLSPRLRTEVLNVLLTRPEWTHQLLDAVADGTVAPAQIDASRRQKLLASSNSSVREKAEKLFNAVQSDRQRVLKQYEEVARLKGDAGRGASLFQQNCAACHRFKEQGSSVGPDLGMTADKSVSALLVAILDPNAALESRYASFLAVMSDDRELSGVISSETPNSITLKLQGGTEETILRSNIKELASSGLSLMPEGFENVLKPQELADVIAFLRTN